MIMGSLFYKSKQEIPVVNHIIENPNDKVEEIKDKTNKIENKLADHFEKIINKIEF